MCGICGHDILHDIENLRKNPTLIQVYPTCIKNYYSGASLVEQWLRICLPIQETRVRALVWEDPTCRRATGPVSHNY